MVTPFKPSKSSVIDAETLRVRLPEIITQAIGQKISGLSGLTNLSGGISRDTWSFDAQSAETHTYQFILQMRQTWAFDSSISIGSEVSVLLAAKEIGAPVATII